MRARDIMTKEVVTVGPEATVREIARLLLDHGISAVPVVAENGRVLGMVSESELIRCPAIGGVPRGAAERTPGVKAVEDFTTIRESEADELDAPSLPPPPPQRTSTAAVS